MKTAIKKSICSECKDKTYTVGFNPQLKCEKDCWIMKAVDKTKKEK